MANLFGKEIEDYRIFADAFPADTARATMQDAINRGGRNIDWAFKPVACNIADTAEGVTQAFGLISNNLEAIKAESDEILRRDFQLNEFVPIDTNVPEGATSSSTKVVNRYGKSKFITKDGKNVEQAEASVGKVTYAIAYGGIVGAWSLQELRESLFSGQNLSNDTLEAAIEACNYHIQEIGFLGSAEEGFSGILNSPDVSVFGGTVPNFNTATAAEIIAFINGLISGIGEDSNEVVYRQFRNSDMQMNLPTRAFDILSNTLYGGNERTLWDFLKMNNSWTARTNRPLIMKSLPEAVTAGASSDARLTLYPKDKRVLEMDMPIAPRITRMIPEAYSTVAPYEYSISGVNWKRGGLAVYADGILG